MIAIDERGLPVIAAARRRILQLTGRRQLSTAEDLYRLVRRSPTDDNKILAAVWLGDQMMGDHPDRFLRVVFEAEEIAEIQLVTDSGVGANLLSWVDASLEDPDDDNLGFKLTAAERIMTIVSRAGCCIKCGHHFSREERAVMEEFRVRNGRTGYRRACPDCGTAFFLIGLPNRKE